MDRLNTYALIAALKGLDGKPRTSVGRSRSQNDKWTALLSVEKQEMYPRLDEEPRAKAVAAPPRASYVRQINNRINEAVSRQMTGPV